MGIEIANENWWLVSKGHFVYTHRVYISTFRIRKQYIKSIHEIHMGAVDLLSSLFPCPHIQGRALDLCPVSKGTGSVIVSRPNVSRPSGIADGLFPDEPTSQAEARHLA